MALPILLDCDPGHDDAIAIVLALASPELDVKAITSSAGNQTPEKTLRNVLRMLTLLRIGAGLTGAQLLLPSTDSLTWSRLSAFWQNV